MVGLCKSYAKWSDCTNITVASFTDDRRSSSDYVSTWKSTGFRLGASLWVSSNLIYYFECCVRYAPIFVDAFCSFDRFEWCHRAFYLCNTISVYFCIYALNPLNRNYIWPFVPFFIHIIFRYNLQATYTATWNTDLCMTEHLMDNLTRCICPISGTYVVLMSKRNYNVSRSLWKYSFQHFFRLLSAAFNRQQFDMGFSWFIYVGFLK